MVTHKKKAPKAQKEPKPRDKPSKRIIDTVFVMLEHSLGLDEADALLYAQQVKYWNKRGVPMRKILATLQSSPQEFVAGFLQCNTCSKWENPSGFDRDTKSCSACLRSHAASASSKSASRLALCKV